VGADGILRQPIELSGFGVAPDLGVEQPRIERMVSSSDSPIG
jgi:hypothetical protein